MMRINCDIGERGHDHPVDRRLMEVIHIANLACGGHAGNSASVQAFRALAEENGVELAAHLSFPDRSHFGRRLISMPVPSLLASLEEQLGLLADVRRVKFHGALYNESCRNRDLAADLSQWLAATGIREILAPEDTAIARAARNRGIVVRREAFAERRYEYDESARRLSLVDRSQPHASLSELESALAQAKEIIKRRRVNVSHSSSGHPQWQAITADTLCIHSDSPIALELAVQLRRLIEAP
ncbi:MAG: LamB/YcsF family protein [Chrysiogenales bacterium]|nr:MAG: LamB/YcsF family protein [Chrysiogenales bacterium]